MKPRHELTTARIRVEPRWHGRRRRWHALIECPCGVVQSRMFTTDHDRTLAIDHARATHAAQWPTCPHRAGLPAKPTTTEDEHDDMTPHDPHDLEATR